MYEVGEESVGSLLLNLITRGLKAEAENFYHSLPESDRTEAILSDTTISEKEWTFILQNLTDENIRSQVLTQRSLARAIFEENLRQKDEFDFYS